MRVLMDLERDAAGLAVVSRAETRLSLAVVALVTIAFAACASWDLFAPHLAGHYAASASLGIAADNMLRWDIIAPVWEYTHEPPPPSLYYCHHPWGIFWVTTAFVDLLGRHDAVCRLPAVLLSTATPPLLFLLGRALWRPIAGAVAALGFAVLPISLAFAHFNALEVPVIAWTTLGAWGFVRHQQCWRARYLAASLAGFFMALHSDWPAFVYLSALLCFGALRGIVFRRALGRVALRAHARWWVLSALMMAAVGAFYLVMFQRAGKLADLADSAALRSTGAGTSVSAVLASRAYWIAAMFTPLGVALGKLGAVVLAVRVLWLRRPLDAVPLCLLAMATFQYLVFRQGADVHIYWPHYFAPFFGLALGALTDTALASAARHRSGRASWAVTAGAIALCLPIARDGAELLVYGRATGGRFNEKGALIHSDGRKHAFLAWLAPQLPEGATVAMHEGMKTTWSQVWTLGGRVVRPFQRRPPNPDEPAWNDDAFLVDTRFLLPGMQRRVAGDHHVVAVGPFWWIRPAAAAAPLDAFAIVEREPNAWERYWHHGTEPVRGISPVPDPYLTWELRTHFDQPAAAPTSAPVGLEQLRIAHNIAVAEGRDPSAPLAALLAEMTPLSLRFDDGTELVASRFDDGVRPRLTLLYRAAAPAKWDVVPTVRSRVIAPPRWSSTPADPVVRDVSLPPAIAPRLWRAGFLYSHAIDIAKRPGVEAFDLTFTFRTPPPGDAAPPAAPRTLVLTLPE